MLVEGVMQILCEQGYSFFSRGNSCRGIFFGVQKPQLLRVEFLLIHFLTKNGILRVWAIFFFGFGQAKCGGGVTMDV